MAYKLKADLEEYCTEVFIDRFNGKNLHSAQRTPRFQRFTRSLRKKHFSRHTCCRKNDRIQFHCLTTAKLCEAFYLYNI